MKSERVTALKRVIDQLEKDKTETVARFDDEIAARKQELTELEKTHRSGHRHAAAARQRWETESRIKNSRLQVRRFLEGWLEENRRRDNGGQEIRRRENRGQQSNREKTCRKEKDDLTGRNADALVACVNSVKVIRLLN